MRRCEEDYTRYWALRTHVSATLLLLESAMANLLDQLKSMTTVVSDTGDINAIKQYKPTDSTTNPSLIATAAGMPEYQKIVDDVLDEARKKLGDKASDKD